MEYWSVWLLWGSYKTIHKRNYTTILSNKNRGDKLEIFSCNVSKGKKPTEIVLQKNSSVSAVEIVSPRTTTPIFKTIGWKDENGPFSAPLPRQMNERNASNKWWRSKSTDRFPQSFRGTVETERDRHHNTTESDSHYATKERDRHYSTKEWEKARDTFVTGS